MPVPDLIKFRNDLAAFDWEAEVIAIIERNKEVLADLQAEQLFTGRNRKGENIYPEYAPLTVEIKKAKGQPTDRVTYRDTGELYRELKAFISGDQFYFDSDNFKFAAMVKRSGVNVIGLNEEMRRRFVFDVFLPEFKQVLFHKTGLELKL